MRKGLPLTFEDAVAFAREMAMHSFVARAETRQDGRKLRVHLELSEAAAFFSDASEDSGIWYDLVARPPRLMLEGVGRPDWLRKALEEVGKAALAEIA